MEFQKLNSFIFHKFVFRTSLLYGFKFKKLALETSWDVCIIALKQNMFNVQNYLAYLEAVNGIIFIAQISKLLF